MTRFLSQPLILEESGPPRVLLQLLVLISLVVGSSIAWATVTEIQEIAVTRGQVVPAGSVNTVQHLEGGIISEILVEDGQVVDAGQTLIRFEAAAATAELEQLRAREAALALKAERLRAYVFEHEPDFSMSRSHPDLASDQRVILSLQNEARAGQRAVAMSRIEQRQAELRALREQEANIEDQLKIIDEEVTMRRQLLEKGLASRIVYLETERAHTQMLGELAQVQGNQRRTLEALNEARNSLVELEATLGNEALDEMGSVTAELTQLREQMANLEDRVERLQVSSPARGIVKGLITRTVGSVISAGEILMEIVPVEDELIAEVEIDPKDVGHIRVGQPARVKVTTFDVARFGAIDGRLEHVSASTFRNKDGVFFYKGRISLAQNHVGEQLGRNLVLPGMEVDVDINTGSKSVFRYLLKPVYRSFDTALRER